MGIKDFLYRTYHIARINASKGRTVRAMASEQIINRQCILLLQVLDLPSALLINSEACLLLRFSDLVAGHAIAKQLFRIKVSSMNDMFTEDFLVSEMQNGNYHSLAKSVNVIEELHQNYTDLDELKSRISNCTDSLLSNLNQIKLLPNLSFYKLKVLENSDIMEDKLEISSNSCDEKSLYSNILVLNNTESCHEYCKPILTITEVHSSEVIRTDQDKTRRGNQNNNISLPGKLCQTQDKAQCSSGNIHNNIQENIQQNSEILLNVSETKKHLYNSEEVLEHNSKLPTVLNKEKLDSIILCDKPPEKVIELKPNAGNKPSKICDEKDNQILNSCYKIFSTNNGELSTIAPTSMKLNFDNFNVMRKRSRSTPSKFNLVLPTIPTEITRETIAERKIARSLFHSCSEDDLSKTVNECNTFLNEDDKLKHFFGEQNKQLLESEPIESRSSLREPSKLDSQRSIKRKSSPKKNGAIKRKPFLESKKILQSSKLPTSTKRRPKSFKLNDKTRNTKCIQPMIETPNKSNYEDAAILDKLPLHPSCYKPFKIPQNECDANPNTSSKINDAMTTAENANFSSCLKPIQAWKKTRPPTISLSEIELRTKAISAHQMIDESIVNKKISTVDVGTDPLLCSEFSNKKIENSFQV